MFAWLRVVALGLVTLLALQLPKTNAERDAPSCAICPDCGGTFSFLQRRCFSVHPPAAHAQRCLMRMFDEEVVGQRNATDVIRRLLARKLQDVEQRCILHFLGDNGVGKSHVAAVISRALSNSMSDRAGDGEGEYGATMLNLPTAFEGIPLPEARKHVVNAVATHLKRYPLGIILIDDIQNLKDDHFKLLEPLLVKNGRYLEIPDVALNKATIILTSDLGKAGISRGKTYLEMLDIARQSLSSAFPEADVRAVHSIPFASFDENLAEAMIRHEVARTPCRLRTVVRAEVTDAAVALLLRDMLKRKQLTERNGRAIADRIREDEVDGKISVFVASARGAPDMKLRVVLDASRKGDGSLTLVVHPEDGLTPIEDL